MDLYARSILLWKTSLETFKISLIFWANKFFVSLQFYLSSSLMILLHIKALRSPLFLVSFSSFFRSFTSFFSCTIVSLRVSIWKFWPSPFSSNSFNLSVCSATSKTFSSTCLVIEVILASISSRSGFYSSRVTLIWFSAEFSLTFNLPDLVSSMSFSSSFGLVVLSVVVFVAFGWHIYPNKLWDSYDWRWYNCQLSSLLSLLLICDLFRHYKKIRKNLRLLLKHVSDHLSVLFQRA